MTLDSANWERLQELCKEAGKPYFMSKLIDDFIGGLLPVMEQAAKDAKEKKKMTQAEMEEKYNEMAKASFKDI